MIDSGIPPIAHRGQRTDSADDHTDFSSAVEICDRRPLQKSYSTIGCVETYGVGVGAGMVWLSRKVYLGGRRY